MSDVLPTVKIVASAPEQGEFVVINESDYDADAHTLYGAEPDDAADERAELVEQIIALGGEKPHHKTGVAKLQETLAALKAAE